MATHSEALTLADAVWPPIASRRMRAAVLALAGSVLLALSAKIQIPFWPVPLTLQTFVVLVLGMTYGSQLAAATMLLYLAQGGLGLPVFAAGAGWAYFAGPTGGYLIGMAIAAVLMGFLAQRGWGKSARTAVAAMLLGTAVIFTFGLLWLGYVIGYDKAVSAGLIPFLPGEALKIIAAAIMLPTCWRICGRPGSESSS